MAASGEKEGVSEMGAKNDERLRRDVVWWRMLETSDCDAMAPDHSCLDATASIIPPAARPIGRRKIIAGGVREGSEP